MTNHTTLTVKVTPEQADRLLAIVNGEITANQNRLVTATLATSDYRDQAVPLAQQVENDVQLRCAINRARGVGA